MTVEQVNIILKFMERTQLQGSEAPKFMECVQVLQEEGEKHKQSVILSDKCED